MGLPQEGQLNWGIDLNAAIQADEQTLATVQTGLQNHENNSPADPHGDRAYALALVTPIVTGVNGPNGYVRLDQNGKLPLPAVPVGAGLTNWIDVIPDYGVPTNGLSDASASLNGALYQTSVNGGGVVYVGDGTFGLANPLLVYPNTWLLCSPGAKFVRLNTGTPPAAMIQNYQTGITPQGGNIRITGGTWEVDSLSVTGCFFSFANAQNITVENLSVTAYPDGNSPVGQLFGCTDVTLQNIQTTALLPIDPIPRSSCRMPWLRVEELNAFNLPGLPNTIYSAQECRNVAVINCSLDGETLSDTYGVYTVWTSFCGTKGTMLSGAFHVNISITGGCFATGFAVAAVEVLNWQNVKCTGNFFTYPRYPYVTTWDGVVAQVSTFIFDACSPRSYAPVELGTCQDTVVETLLAKFMIPGNDWIPGSTCYRHRHTGFLTCGSLSDTLIINLRVGPNGDETDTIVETITLTIEPGFTGIPYCFEHRGFDIDDQGYWNSCGAEFRCRALTAYYQVTITETVFQPQDYDDLYVTHWCTWGNARADEICEARGGVHERLHV